MDGAVGAPTAPSRKTAALKYPLASFSGLGGSSATETVESDFTGVSRPDVVALGPGESCQQGARSCRPDDPLGHRGGGLGPVATWPGSFKTPRLPTPETRNLQINVQCRELDDSHGGHTVPAACSSRRPDQAAAALGSSSSPLPLKGWCHSAPQDLRTMVQ